MKTVIFAASTVAVLASAFAAGATPLMRTVYCADGTVYKVGDHVTNEQVCANHGGVMPLHQRPPSGGILKDDSSADFGSRDEREPGRSGRS